MDGDRLLKHNFPAFLSTFTPAHALRNQGKQCIDETRGRLHRCWQQQGTRPLAPLSMSTQMPEIPEVNLPEPAIPKKGDILPGWGDETAVISVDDSPTEGESLTKETTWLESILSTRPDLPETSPLNYLRMTAEAVLLDSELPNRKQESWRFTDLRSLYASRYASVDTVELNVNDIDIEKHIPVKREDADSMLVFLNGKFSSELSSVDVERNAERFVGSIHEYPGDINALMFMWNRGELGDDVKLGAGFFPKIGNALASDAAIIDVNTKLDKPIVVVHLTTNGSSPSASIATAPRTAVMARAESSFTLYECHVALPFDDHHVDSSSLNGNDVLNRGSSGTCSTILNGTSLTVDPKAKLQHIFLNATTNESSLIGVVHTTVEDEGQYHMRVIGIGGTVGRLTAGIDLNGGKANASMRGILISDGYRTQDLHSRVQHNNKGTTFDQRQKNISSEHGRVVFAGKIIVTEKCLETISHQLSNSLLMSEKASVDSMPVLEIANDDVECTHGATVSDISEDELFYFRSRGLSHVEAQSLLILGFAKDIFQDCNNERLTEIVAKKLDYISENSKERDNSEASFLTM